MLGYYWPLTIVLLLLAPPSSGQDLTTCHTRPQDPFSQPYTDKSTGATFYIDLNNPFTCHGVIKQWRFCYRRSPGALFDTIKFGVYAPNSDGDTYIKKGSNSIYIGSLKNQECLYRDADPQLVVQQGYYIAWYASLIFIEYFDDPVNGHLYRSVAFPNSISHGVLIKTPDIRAPKIHALLQNLDPVITSTSTTSTSTSTAAIQPSIVIPPSVSTGAQMKSAVMTVFPSPTQTLTTSENSSLGIPPPDLNFQQCNLGVEELFATSFLQIGGLYVNDVHLSICSGLVREIVFCYRFVKKTSYISIGIWRSIGPDNFTAVEEFEIMIEPEGIHPTDPLMCTAVLVNGTHSVAPGDLVGFQSSDIEMAFGDEISTENNDRKLVPLLRAILDVQPVSMESSIRSSSVVVSPMITSTAKGGNIGAVIGGIAGGVLGAVAIAVIVVSIIMLYMCFCNRSGSYRPRSQTQKSMVYNAAYASKKESLLHTLLEDSDQGTINSQNLSYSYLDKGDLEVPPSTYNNTYEEVDPYNVLRHN